MTEWKQFKKQPCVACSHVGYCTTDGKVVRCMRAERGKTFHDKNGTPYWLHRLDANGQTAVESLPKSKIYPKLSINELKSLAKQHRTALSPARLEAASKELGVSVQSLKRIGIGWDSGIECISFPMYDGQRRIIGIQRRYSDVVLKQRKCVNPKALRYLTMGGTTPGLFMPDDYEAEPIVPMLGPDDHDACPLLLVIPEGPTSLAAALDLGFRAISRPSNTGGGEYLKVLLANGAKQDVVLMADKDELKRMKDQTPFWPGWEGALCVAEQIHSQCGQLRIVHPPAKDLREWIKSGGVAGIIRDVIGKAVKVDAAWLRAERSRLAGWKQHPYLKKKATVAA